MQKLKGSCVLFLLLFYFFIFRDLMEQYIHILSYVDEGIAVLAFPICFLCNFRRRIRVKLRNPGIYITFFIFLGLFGNFWYEYQPMFKIALPAALLCMKFWLSIYTGRYLFRKLDLENCAGTIYFHVRFIIWMYLILSIANYFKHDLFPATIRYGIPAIQLFYRHPTILAANCAFLFVILIALKPYVRSCQKYIVFLLLLLCSTLRTKAFACALLFGLLYYFAYIRKKKVRVRTILFFVPVVLLLAWDQIYFYFLGNLQSGSARYQLMEKSLRIAIDYFPIGAGFGTFGSYFSAVSYSPLYGMYGISNIYGLQKGAASFVSDSFWPMILGETGFLGCLFMVLAIVGLFHNIQKLRSVSPASYVSAISIFFYLIISSTAEAAFVSPVAIPLAIWLGVLMKNKNEERVWNYGR